MNIGSRGKYPASALSNFAFHPFVIDGVECNSMEGFLQSLKFKNPEMQKEICKLVGLTAKRRGASKKWWREQTLYWKRVSLPRKSLRYQVLLDDAYEQLSLNKNFKKALLATGNAVLKHSIGKRKESETVLTEREFCSRLMKIRERYEAI